MSFQYFSGEVRGLRGPGLTAGQAAQIDAAIASAAFLQDQIDNVVVNTAAADASLEAHIVDVATDAADALAVVAGQQIGLNRTAPVQLSGGGTYLVAGAKPNFWTYSKAGYGAVALNIPLQSEQETIRVLAAQRTKIGADVVVRLFKDGLAVKDGVTDQEVPVHALAPASAGLNEYTFVVPNGKTANQVVFETNGSGLNSGDIFAAITLGNVADVEAASDSASAELLLRAYYEIERLDRRIAALSTATLGADSWTEADRQILWPTPVAFRSGQLNTLYGRQMTTRRDRQAQVDVHLISSAEHGAGTGLSAFLTPQYEFTTEQLVNTSCRIEVKDETVPNKIWIKDFTARIANETQTGEIPVCFFADSTGAIAFEPFLHKLTATGATFKGIGTRLLFADDNFEGRPGWSAMDYMGRTRPTTFGVNPFLRSLSVSVPGELAIIQANATKCFADDAAYGTDPRPSYAQNNSRPRYSIFSWAYWRTNPAVALTGAEKLRVIMQLGRNGGGDRVADNALAQSHFVDDFLAAFPNGSMIVASETIGDGSDTKNNIDRTTGYSALTAPIIAKKIELFSDREAGRVWLAPTWVMMNAYAAFDLNPAEATDPQTGTQRCTIEDVVHYDSQQRSQWAEAVLAPLLYVHQTT